MLPIVGVEVLQLIKLSERWPSHQRRTLIFIHSFFFFTSIRYGVGEGRSGRGDAGKLWDAEEMFKLVACFKSLRVFRWMNVEALSAVWRRAGTS